MPKPTKKVTPTKSKARSRPRPRAQWLTSPALPSVEWNADTIRALREHLQLTQAQLADALGTRQQTISEWEVGMYKPRGGMARLLSLVAERAKFEYNTGEK